MQVLVRHRRLLGVHALHVHAFHFRVNGAVQNPAFRSAFVQHSLPDSCRVPVALFDHTSYLETGGGGAQQAIHRSSLSFESLSLPRFVAFRGAEITFDLEFASGYRRR